MWTATTPIKTITIAIAAALTLAAISQAGGTVEIRDPHQHHQLDANDRRGNSRGRLELKSRESAGSLSIRPTQADETLGRWRLEVSINADVLPEGARVFIRRTGDGTGAGKVTDGRGYMECGALPRQWLSGHGTRTDIAYQYKITGLSSTTRPGDYSLTFHFELLEDQ